MRRINETEDIAIQGFSCCLRVEIKIFFEDGPDCKPPLKESPKKTENTRDVSGLTDIRGYLSPVEAELFDYLVGRKRQVCTINEICNHLKIPLGSDNSSHVFRLRISRLRKWLKKFRGGAEECIKTYHDGYSYVPLKE